MSTRSDDIIAKEQLSRDDIVSLLSISDKQQIDTLFKRAYEVKKQYVSNVVYLRGIIEFSNICSKDCLYCGIRKGNTDLKRFQMTKDEIVSAALWAFEGKYGSVVLQSGERSDTPFVDFVEDVVKTIKEKSAGKLGITLSLGEQSADTYRRWYEAGAHRYLLRIETSNPELYSRIHPPDSIFQDRVECLKLLRQTGFQVGTGVMIGLPGQTLEDLADDVLFFKNIDADMIGMGPYIPHHSTPMGIESATYDAEAQLELGLKMVAVCRIVLKDVNIAAATALQALKFNGRELGVMAGANIIMPNVSDTKYREGYQLYDNKPCLDENSSQCRACLTGRILGIGETIGFEQWGDSPHFRNKTARIL